MISKGKLITTVHFVHAFKLMEQFPFVPLLKNYLKDMRRKSKRKNGNLTNKDIAQVNLWSCVLLKGHFRYLIITILLSSSFVYAG